MNKKAIAFILVTVALVSGFLVFTLVRGSPTGTISVVDDNSGSSTWQIGPSPDPMGSTIYVDVDVTGASGVWGWCIPTATWNPAVLSLQDIYEGSYLLGTFNTKTNKYEYGSTYFLQGVIDNTNGEIDGGVSDCYATSETFTSPNTSGMLMQLQFTVVGYGSCQISVTGTYFEASSSDTTGTLATPNPAVGTLTVANPNGGSPSPTPTPTPSVSPTPTSTPIPTPTPTPTGPITNPETLIVTSNEGSPSPAVGSNIYSSGTAVTCNVPTTSVNVNGVTYNTVTQNGVTYACTGWTGTGSVLSSGVTTSTTFTITANSTITWNWVMIPASLDVYTNNGGQGYEVCSAPFGPEQQVTIYAEVTSQGGVPIAQITVPFNIYDNGVEIDSRTATTNANGIATASYTLPWSGTNPTSAFGTMNITSTIQLFGTTLSDSCPFTYNYLVETSSTTIGNGQSSSNGQCFSRYTGPEISAQVTVQNINWNTESFYLTATIYDNNGVPVAYTSLPLTINAPQTDSLTSKNSQTFTVNLSIPASAFVGSATLYINLYTNDPAKQGVPLCPESTTQLVIDASQ